MPNVFTSAMDVTKPAGTRSKLLGDDDIREFKVQFCERLNVDHMQPQSEGGVDTVGFHRKSTLLKQASDPTAVADALILYAKVAGSYSELHTVHENAGVIQLTRLGKLLISSLGVASEAAGDLVVRGASAWDRMAMGSAYQYLRVNAGATALEWGADPRQPAANTVQASGSSDIQQTPSSYGDMADMSVSITTTGRPIEISFDGSFDVTGGFSGNMRCYIQIVIDGVSKVVKDWRWNTNIYFGIPFSMSWRESGLSAGAHTIKIQWKTDGGANGLGVLNQYGSNGARVLNAKEL